MHWFNRRELEHVIEMIVIIYVFFNTSIEHLCGQLYQLQVGRFIYGNVFIVSENKIHHRVTFRCTRARVLTKHSDSFMSSGVRH